MNIGDWLKEKGQDFKQKRAYKKAANEQIAKKSQAAYFRSKEQQEVKYAENRPVIERQQKEAQLRQPRQRGGGGSGFLAKAGNIAEGISKAPMGLMGGQPPMRGQPMPRRQQQQMPPQMPSMFGGGTPIGLGGSPAQPTQRKRRRKTKRKAKKGTGRTITLRLG